MKIVSGALVVGMLAPVTFVFDPIAGVTFGVDTPALEVELTRQRAPVPPMVEWTAFSFQVLDGQLHATIVPTGLEFPAGSDGLWTLAGQLTFNGTQKVDLRSAAIVVEPNQKVS